MNGVSSRKKDQLTKLVVRRSADSKSAIRRDIRLVPMEDFNLVAALEFSPKPLGVITTDGIIFVVFDHSKQAVDVRMFSRVFARVIRMLRI